MRNEKRDVLTPHFSILTSVFSVVLGQTLNFWILDSDNAR